MQSRPDNVAAGSPAPSPNESVANSTTSDELSDQAWAQTKYSNFRLYVRSLTPQEPKLLAWADWLDKLPLAVFLAGGDGELQGVRGASTDERRAAEAGLVLERWAMDYHFDLEMISEAAREKLRRYIALFSSC